MSGAPANSGQQVLIVEDNEALAENLAELLEPLHVNTRIAGTAGECERALQEVEPAVAIVDVSLPDASGLDVLRTLKTAVKDVEVVFVTGHGSLATAMDAIALGAFGYLLKPVDPEGFAQLVERALSAVSLRAERKQLARALSASETLHRTVVDSVDACVLGLRDSGAIVMANRTGRRLFGDALEGTPFSSLFEGDETIDEKLARCASGEATDGWVTEHGERLI
ncbi:MAG: response regulator, partial [Myxococcota bacterium]